MRISELSRQSGVPVASIKYYLRKGLMPAGRAMGATLAEYGEEHVQRLRLIRALTTLGGLSIAAARDVLAEIDQPHDDPRGMLGVIHYALRTPADAGATGAEELTERVDSLVEAMDWDVSEASPHRLALAASLRELSRLGMDFGVDDLLPYATLAAAVARLDLDQIDGIEDRMALAERAAIITLLLEPVLALLRRLAQEGEARRRTAEAAAPHTA
ncbi:MerR family transcriptional regulator [Streptomyces colonosanans]|uniref:Transcriptional regulator n=1 Tax=Streptomyces colonosanans TaxID=1428652 RepID=A0A1S2NV13_9ACTN|nr:MerR family transcriptional regulator [Streptomyces colonosanans]OIJ85399.1 transcriptional regulator [Streptomyces colonosanans]